jgi:threonylcarbamoyladenosine tRNA methylthiotransferase MtaB
VAPTVSFKTIGCRLNQAETATMTARFTGAGYAVVPFGNPSDVTVVHGCAITGKAEHSSLYAARQARRARGDTLVILAGCPAETLGDTLRGDTSIDLSVGQAGKFALPDLLHRLHPGRFPASGTQSGTAALPHFESQRALVKVQDGCDFGCAYCIVPSARGTPKSRPSSEIMEETRRLAEAGFREIVLTGANLGRYENGDRRLTDLIRLIEQLPGVERLRLSSIELTTTEGPIIAHMANSTQLCHFLHIPLQSGDDGILKAMGRRYDATSYRCAVEQAATAIPGVGLGTDIIVGFPGEDDRAFENTLKLVRELPFSNLHVFPFSRRPGTRAELLTGQVPEHIKKERLRVLVELGETKRLLFSDRFTGKTVRVLIERVAGAGHGWTDEYVAAQVDAPDLKPRQLVAMHVQRVTEGTLVGTLHK